MPARSAARPSAGGPIRKAEYPIADTAATWAAGREPFRPAAAISRGKAGATPMPHIATPSRPRTIATGPGSGATAAPAQTRSTPRTTTPLPAASTMSSRIVCVNRPSANLATVMATTNTTRPTAARSAVRP
jgi:hypothetical protein